ncbi:hypothetical protein FJ444_20625 [Aestuariibacter sp. GS-14]|uniref:hypothetical protein n=1 Tax=Aestuariibacter sp. GS-14 TaxID=2590670 RepID=UPI00112EC54F|nr:hypothetical protein [Aestuariibacter sp. GS-14]TPV53679.1 hypothetical protein FJ444_20625 [Aestuariibacter sp. GS-14]
MRNVAKQVTKSRFEDHLLLYVIMYLLLIAPPRAFRIKLSEKANHGELARIPTFMVVSIELVLRIVFVLVLAACIEGFLGNTFYETHRLDVFFVTLVSVGIVHTCAYFLIFNTRATASVKPMLALLYRLIRNTCYAMLTGFAAVIPVLIWNWDHQLPPYTDGLAVQLYIWTSTGFFVLGLVEARYMNRIPLGAEAERTMISG